MVKSNLADTTVRVGKVPFEVTSLPEAVERIVRAGECSEPVPIRLSNAYCVALASRTPAYADLLNGKGLNFPDGAPVVWFIRKNSGFRKAGRVRGPSLFRESVGVKNANSLRHFFLGTTPDTLEKLCERLKLENPAIHISGTYSPPFSDLDETFYEECVKQVCSTDAQVVWIALGTPKQDFVAAELSARTQRPCVGVGAAFDFAAGTIREAPKWVQRGGVEWLYRLATEPRRLWKRYLIGNFVFLYSALCESKD